MCTLFFRRFRVLTLLLSLAAFLILLLVNASVAKEQPLQTVTKIKDDPTETVWLIKYPEVKKSFTDYPDITFKENDEVFVTGGGCLQTGGRGRTWKRYIDPLGPNSDRLYHGRIWIPGATGGLVRISSLVGSSSLEAKPVSVKFLPKHADFSSSPYFLRLGYEDDHYGDNGYDRHDDGADNQCTLTPLDDEDAPNNGNAWLQIRILHNNGVVNAHASVADRAPFDLVWDEADDNLLPLNPDWWLHASRQIFPNSNRNDDNQGCDQFREGRGDLLLAAKSPKCTTCGIL